MKLESSIVTNEKLSNIPPGEILQEGFLVPMSLSAYKLSKEMNIPQTRISDIIHGKRRITADTALRFSRFFGACAQFWLGLQKTYDVENEEKRHIEELNKIRLLKFVE